MEKAQTGLVLLKCFHSNGFYPRTENFIATRIFIKSIATAVRTKLNANKDHIAITQSEFKGANQCFIKLQPPAKRRKLFTKVMAFLKEKKSMDQLDRSLADE